MTTGMAYDNDKTDREAEYSALLVPVYSRLLSGTVVTAEADVVGVARAREGMPHAVKSP